jgi:hypothetical protein
MNARRAIEVKHMKRNSILMLFLTSAVLFAGCQHLQPLYHKHIMKGTVLETRGKEVTICIGTRDGAKVGQELEVFRFIRKKPSSGSPEGFGRGAQTQPRFERAKTGDIKIIRIINEHFAIARIENGVAAKNYMVELK